MNAPSSSQSPELLQANQRLLELRQLAQKNKAKSGQLVADLPVADVPPWEDPDADDAPATAAVLVNQLPPHLGWGSQTASQIIRLAVGRHGGVAKKMEAKPTPGKPETGGQQSYSLSRSAAGKSHPLTLNRGTVKHYPSIGVATLKKEEAAIYRVWLMCRYLDPHGRGWLLVTELREKITNQDSEFGLFSWRRLRQVLGEGHGRFWTWDKVNGRLWLFGAAQLAANLDVSRLSGKPVALPIKAITKSIGEFKAHLYAAWHSGRRQTNPISREVQKTITGVPERTQRQYCRVAKISRHTNIAIGSKYTQEEAEKQAWRRGQASFIFTDHNGNHGRKGTSYTAWHLPNSYISPHQQTTNGRMRKINQKLNVLVHKGARGNGSEKVEKTYFANGKDAARALNRGLGKEIYWPTMTVSMRSQFWTVFSFG